MKIISQYKFSATLDHYTGWATTDNLDEEVDEVMQRLMGTAAEKSIIVDACDIEAISLIEKSDKTFIELLTFNGGVITLCEERADDIVNFWKSATEVTEEEKPKPK